MANISRPNWRGPVDAAFWFVAISVFLSGLLLWIFGEETHQKLNPA